jgi:hypothetical protein
MLSICPPVNFTRFAQRIRPIHLLKFTVQRSEQDRSAFWLQIPSANNTADRTRTSVESFLVAAVRHVPDVAR